MCCDLSSAPAVAAPSRMGARFALEESLMKCAACADGTAFRNCRGFCCQSRLITMRRFIMVILTYRQITQTPNLVKRPICGWVLYALLCHRVQASKLKHVCFVYLACVLVCIECFNLHEKLFKQGSTATVDSYLKPSAIQPCQLRSAGRRTLPISRAPAGAPKAASLQPGAGP